MRSRVYGIIRRYKGTQGWTWDLCKSCIVSGHPYVRYLSHNNNYIQATECPRCLKSKLSRSLASLNSAEQMVTGYMSNSGTSLTHRDLSVSLSIHYLSIYLSIYQLYFCLRLNTSYKFRSESIILILSSDTEFLFVLSCHSIFFLN